ncbi:hypothetical protein VNO80_20702 [Phaseolus coccineus]|uniref:Uncharacterized protein n=1 Tax=Phaseolus coccineus TaxID=3886 RepID=A0AAN9QSD5_PHACN
MKEQGQGKLVSFMAQKTIMLTFLFFLVLQHDFVLLTASRKNIHIQPPPAIPRSPQHPTLQWHTTNEESVSGDAFRPTSPGHSPGVGHDTPPTKP